MSKNHVRRTPRSSGASSLFVTLPDLPLWSKQESAPLSRIVVNLVDSACKIRKILLLQQGGDRFAKRPASKSGVVAGVGRLQPPLRRSLDASRRIPSLVKEGNFYAYTPNLALVTCLLLFLLTHFSPAQSDFDKVGTAGAQFLKLGVGARANGMGGAYIGMVDGAGAAFWNPAGLAKIEKRDIDFSHLSWIADIRHDALSYAHHWSGVGVFALSFVQLGAPDMEVTTTQQQEGTGEMFTCRDLAIGLSYARNLTDAFAVGITVKYIDEQIYTYHARGIAFDIGTQYRTGFYSLSISFAISNFGQDLRFGGAYLNTEVVPGTTTLLSEEREFASFPLPLRFSGGLTYDLLNRKNLKSRLALDGLHFNDYSERIHLGSENWIRDILALRAGYKFNYQEEGLTLGLGLQTRIDNFYLRFDYAYSDLGVFDRVDTFSVNFSF